MLFVFVFCFQGSIHAHLFNKSDKETSEPAQPQVEGADKMAKGVGPYAEYWKPIPTYKYWVPNYFYTPPAEPKGVYSRQDCVVCHKV